MKIISTSILVTACLFFSACGFTPMHAPTGLGTSGVHYNDISVVMLTSNKVGADSIAEDKVGFLLKQSLRDRIGNTHNPRYSLRITPSISRGGLGIGGDDVASRYDLTMYANIELLDIKTGKVLFNDNVRSISTFAAPRDPYGTIAAENNATEQVAKETADRILVRLSRYQSGQDR